MKSLLHYFNLDTEAEDFNVIHETIEKGIIFRGTNLWILMFAIVIASVGLNMNSPAVIIGAMLISPLMGPINGLGYGIATYDLDLFRRSMKNFSFAVAASLVASTLYFVISPVSSAHSEILARTTPTIYDVLIALFGGLAGILAISSKQKGNVLPGVAIATALMPPLCTSGYGIATGQPLIFAGAFFLFTINTVFIAISSVAISRLLKFPPKVFMEEARKRRVHRIVTLVILLTLIPSIYLGYGLVKQEQFKEDAGKFIATVSSIDGSFLLKSEVKPSRRTITLIYGGKDMAEETKNNLYRQAAMAGLEKEQLDIRQGFSFKDAEGKISEPDRLKSEANRLLIELSAEKRRADSIAERVEMGKILLREIQALSPEIIRCTYAETIEYAVTDSAGIKVAVITLVHRKIPDRRETERLDNWLKARLTGFTTRIFHAKE